MKKRILLMLCMAVSLFATVNAANDVKWALKDLPSGCTFQDFNDGIAVCYDTIKRKYGAIDKNGEIIIPITYDYLSDFNGDCAIARTKEGDGLINNINKYVLSPQANFRIQPIIVNVERHNQILKNCFLVEDVNQQMQAIFHKDKFITTFTTNHSVEYDLLYPFMRIDDKSYLNVETDEIFQGIVYDMGSYYLLLNETDSTIIAIHKDSYEDVTMFAIGTEISGNATAKKACQIKYENTQWQVINQKGKMIQMYDTNEGWECVFPFWQCGLVSFQRVMSDGSSQIVFVSMETGKVIYERTAKGRMKYGLYPRLHSVSPTATFNMKEAAIIVKAINNDVSAKQTMISTAQNNANIFDQVIELYSIPYILIEENHSDNKNKTIQIIDPIMPKKQYIFNLKEGSTYHFVNNIFIYAEDTLEIAFDFIKDKKYPLQKLLDYSNNIILAIDTKNQYIIIDKNGKRSTLSDFQNILLFNEGVAIAENKDTKVVINPQGKILMQDCNDYKIVGNQSSENAIIMLNQQNNQLCFAYNPLVKDTLQYNSDNKIEQIYSQGLNYYENKKYVKASRCFEKIIKHDSKNVNALTKYADCLTAQRYYAAGLNYYDRALKIDPSNTQAAKHRDIAQTKKEKAEYAAALAQAILGATYNALDAANQAYNSQASSTQATSAGGSATSSNNGSVTSGTNRNDSMYKNADSRTYGDYESQLIKMNTYWETQYNDRDRRYIQSKMREIRKKWEARGYKMFHSPWEDWDGRKK